MLLVDTDVVSEARKGERANAGVLAFFDSARRGGVALYLSVVTIGELRQGVERIRLRGDLAQAVRLEAWLSSVVDGYADQILPVDAEIAQIWGYLRARGPENPIDKQIAATALLYDLAVVTRNVSHFSGTGVRLVNPFS